MTIFRGGLGALGAALALAAPALAGGSHADLTASILKPHSMRVGARSVFQVRVTNHGPDPAKHVVIEDHVSKRGRIKLARVLGSTPPVSCHLKRRRARCPIQAVDAHDEVTMVVAIRGHHHGHLVDKARVTSNVPDPHSGDDSDRVKMRVRRR